MLNTFLAYFLIWLALYLFYNIKVVPRIKTNKELYGWVTGVGFVLTIIILFKVGWVLFFAMWLANFVGYNIIKRMDW